MHSHHYMMLSFSAHKHTFPLCAVHWIFQCVIINSRGNLRTVHFFPPFDGGLCLFYIILFSFSHFKKNHILFIATTGINYHYPKKKNRKINAIFFVAHIPRVQCCFCTCLILAHHAMRLTFQTDLMLLCKKKFVKLWIFHKSHAFYIDTVHGKHR